MRNELERVAFTAYRVMFYVALEQFQSDEHRIIHDNLACQMLPRRLQLRAGIFSFRPLRKGFLGLIDHFFPGVLGNICRKRYIDDKLVEALGMGINNVVILGSGLDTCAYRLPMLSTLQVYEVDLPQTIAYKERKLQQLYGSVPSHVKLIPIDFDRQALGDVLTSYGYSYDQKSFFSWEGVTQYISETAVRTVFEFLAGARPGSRIVFTYIVKDFIDGEKTYGLERLYRMTRGKSPMWQFGLPPSQVAAFIGIFVERIGTGGS